MKQVIKLTEISERNGRIEINTVLIGVESIIRIRREIFEFFGGDNFACTKIDSRHALVCTTNVVESVEEIYALINE